MLFLSIISAGITNLVEKLGWVVSVVKWKGEVFRKKSILRENWV